ncbi:VOC family protein [Paenisporosarcina antarctica]|uniref:VOC family protein n=1 Tax=Paenisporosarcina antarctica TaxID=417367 RepID=A0A4P7A2Q2_9BACL|nr:VOC family protein [Paenisporosarcina antarctica]QBP42226.1 VOC family protein [Paenisporosarcina antarctica]
MKPVIPYLSFYGNGKDAAIFYETIFELENTGIMKYSDGDFPHPPEAADFIMHCHLTNGNFSIMLADSATPGESGTTNVALMVECESEEEVNRLYNALLEDGKAIMELQDTFWGAKYAKVLDKFGYTWDLNFEKGQVE